jgi:HD-GYP domain-containing protein (c-di-GMP phosphodiesterase class II)/cell division septation protein DedD
MVRFSDLKNLTPNNNRKRAGMTPNGPDFRSSSATPSDAPPPAEASMASTGVYKDAVVYLSGVFSAVKKGRPFDLEPGFRIVRQMVESAAAQDALFIRAIQLDERQNFLVNKCINVAVYSIRAAEQLEYSKEIQVEIGMAALLHEVGMCRLPEKILYKKEQLTQQEFGLVQKHSEAGYEILKPYSGSSPYLAEVALQVHERIDGSGYPRGLKGDEIHEYAQIVGLMDIYEALSHSRPQRERFNPFYAIKEIIKTCKPKFHKKHLKALLNAFSIFPLSTYVRLNSNAVGRVIQTYPDQPMRPRLQIEYDSQGRKVLTDRVVNLPENSLLYIVDSVEEEELQQLAEGRGLRETSPRQFQDRDVSPAGTEPVSLQSPEKTPKPAKKKALREKGAGARPLLLLLLLLVLLGGIPYWKGRQSVPLSSASNQATEHVGRIIRPEAVKRLENTASLQAAEKDEVLSPEMVGREKTTDLKDEEALPQPASPSFQALTEKVETAQAYASASRAPFSILLGSYRSAALAERAMTQYRAGGINPYRVKVDLGRIGIWHRIFFGQYPSFSEAQKAADRIPIKEAVVKRTPFAALVGSYPNSEKAAAELYRLQSLGYSPYLIEQENGGFHLWVGAFYTRQGAEEQTAELLAQGVKSRVVER